MVLVKLLPQLSPLFQERRGDENKKYEDACGSGVKWGAVAL